MNYSKRILGATAAAIVTATIAIGSYHNGQENIQYAANAPIKTIKGHYSSHVGKPSYLQPMSHTLNVPTGIPEGANIKLEDRVEALNNRMRSHIALLQKESARADMLIAELEGEIYKHKINE